MCATDNGDRDSTKRGCFLNALQLQIGDTAEFKWKESCEMIETEVLKRTECKRHYLVIPVLVTIDSF